MNDDNKLLFSDSGEGHSSIKWQWICAILVVLCYGSLFYLRWRDWQFVAQIYGFWSESPPTFPSFADLLLLIFPVIVVALIIATGKAIGKNEIYVYNNLIKGYGIKSWGFLPRVHHFELKYDEILSVKTRKGKILIRSMTGRYEIFVHSPEIAHKIISQFYIDGQDIK